jgi:nitrite reductase (NADH) small subunit
MAFVPAGKVSRLSRDSVMECMIGDTPYAICNDAGTIRALNGICPHSGGPLGQGTVQDGRVVCPYHMWEFDCTTGEYDRDPDVRVPTYEVKLQGDDILVQVD